MTKEWLDQHYFVVLLVLQLSFRKCWTRVSRRGVRGLRVASWVLYQQQSAVEIGGSVVLQLALGLKCVCVKLIEALFSCYRYGLLLTGDSSHWSVRGSTGGWGCSLRGDGETKPHQHLITGATQRCLHNWWVGKDCHKLFQKIKIIIICVSANCLFILISLSITLCHKSSHQKYFWQINWPS